VILVESEQTVIRYEVAKHACENTTVKAYKEKKSQKASPVERREHFAVSQKM
jgi:hypothetical protein